MNKKVGLKGLDRVQLLPLAKNDYAGYSVTGEKFFLQNVTEMTRDIDISKQKFYGDDKLYMDVGNFNGENVSMTFLDMRYETLEKLGFGTTDALTGVFSFNPQGSGMSFGVTFRRKQVGAKYEYRMYKMFVFTPTQVIEQNIRFEVDAKSASSRLGDLFMTAGSSVEIGTYQVTGTFTNRDYDSEFLDMKDAETRDDLSWLDDIETVGSAEGGEDENEGEGE